MKAFLFDMDGTLIDSELLWVEAMETVMGQLEFHVSRAESVELVYGRAWPDIYRKLKSRYPDLALSKDALQQRLATLFLSLRLTRDISIPSSITLLRKLAASLPVAVVSGSTRADVDDGIRLMGIGPCLRFSLACEDYAPGKPHPACYLKAAAKLGVEPADCVVFEDSEAGVKAAKAAGMYCVALQRPGMPAQDLSSADRILTDLAGFDP